ncbi:RNA polymerase II elongation factor ELL2, partial [Podiceps cristatus]
LGKRVQVRRAAQGISDAAPERKRSTPMNPANTIRRTHTPNIISQRPYRDRVIHLLALKSYKKPELLARLHRDGVNQKDKNSLGTVLQQVASLNPKDNCYVLKDHIFKEIQKDWPGYNEVDKQSLEIILSRKLNSSQNTTSTGQWGSPVTSNKNASSASSQKRILNSDFMSPLRKKQRISRLTTRLQPTRLHPSFSGHLSAFCEKGAAAPPPPPPAAAATIPAPLPRTLLPAAHPPQTASSPGTPEGQGPEDMPVDSFNQNSSSICERQQQKYTSWTRLGAPAPAAVQMEPPKPAGGKPVASQGMPKKPKEHKEENKGKAEDSVSHASKEEKDLTKEETAKLKEFSHSDSGVKETCTTSADPTSTTDEPDYFIKYITIGSYEQRQSYKDDFYAEYDEYRYLHARMESITRKFMKLDAQRKLLSPGSKEYQILHEEVIEEYRKLKQTSPSYYEEKHRCEYLHNKLSHIKRLIREYDEQQAEPSH